ncbi:hypothetical protein MGYG_06920 [Nannizzia gypsea CBS 118893]|uniref:C6 finger domain-containing protein n=1 Tax=Arthroderma gypseum (strain ATCC MYA-4604 / CBS 118893) TaxID=535722 RepID=E4V1K6_ARTGP|nr:hypothetical protein MGYG_06920 [Nannizzia gypsea CBS 118893]EFR03921.1 hypothetical protein MGYG_06920 [Nannizzia gypsea CBS 118893]
MAEVELTADGLVGLDYSPRAYLSHSWPDETATTSAAAAATSSATATTTAYDAAASADPGLMAEWHFQRLQPHLQFHQHQHHQHQHHQHQHHQSQPDYSYTTMPLQSPIGLPMLPVTETEVHHQHQQHHHMDATTAGMLDGSSYLPLSTPVDLVPFTTWHEFQAELGAFPMDGTTATTTAAMSAAAAAAASVYEAGSSPVDSYLEVRSLTSASSDNGWTAIDRAHSIESSPFQDHHHGHHHHHQQHHPIFINPSQTLHNRSLSESSFSDHHSLHSRNSFGSFVDVSLSPLMHSPGSESALDFDYGLPLPRRVSCDLVSHGSISPTAVSPIAMVRPMPVLTKKQSASSPTRSPKASSTASSSSGSGAGSHVSAAGSPPSRKPSRKSPIAAKNAETKVRKQSTGGKDGSGNGEKKIGKRKGPLRPDQRKQASEIRKLRACLRCKFLKKTCDKGEPCTGCQPSHARLWQVPCTRIDIKEIGYFMKDWKADYERHVTLGFSVGNITGFSDQERTLFITHGYGQVLPVKAREVYVHDEECFNLDWVETMNRPATHFDLKTAKLSAGMEGISTAMLSDYLDRHIDGNGSYEGFVDEYFAGTPFLTQMLKTAYRFYFRTKLPVIRKALKLTLAYNLTMHVTMVEGLGELEEEAFSGKVDDCDSQYNGKVMAPVMINFQVKCAMANMWRELQKDVLEELSALYSSVYSGEKLKNWPIIFMLATILLAVWEEMQFDCHYRVQDPVAVTKFCNDMESIPVGVIVGLFQAISQKLPAFTDWDTAQHQQIFNFNSDVCAAMTEVRGHVRQYETYLRGRGENSIFDREDFDCLSNKFVSRLVIRAN